MQIIDFSAVVAAIQSEVGVMLGSVIALGVGLLVIWVGYRMVIRTIFSLDDDEPLLTPEQRAAEDAYYASDEFKQRVEDYWRSKP